jgi:MYXO-CTERM domain-containing protein
MMHITKAPRSAFRAAVVLGLSVASLGFARTTQASTNYPPILAAAIAKKYPLAVKCVPLCTACHLTTAGGPKMLNVFGVSMEAYGLLPKSPNTVEPAFDALAAADPDSDGDKTHDIEEIVAGNSPSLAFPAGEGEFCPDIKYGCGAHIAATPPPPVDRVGLFSAGLVVLGFALARRRRRAVRTQRALK